MERVQHLLDKRIIREVTPIFDTRALGYSLDARRRQGRRRATRTAPRSSSTRTRASRTTTCATTSSTCGSRSPSSRTPSSACDGHARRDGGQDRRRVDPPAADAEAVQDPHGPRDGGRAPTRSRPPARPSSRWSSTRSSCPTSDVEVDPRHPGPDGGALATPYAPAAERLGVPVAEVLARLESLRERGGLRRVAAILYHRRAGFSANGMGVWAVPDGRDPRHRRAGWPRSAASRTATSARPTPTGRTRCSRWPTGAPRRSATRCSTRSPRTTGISERATLYSSTEFKKVRMLYFTDDFKRWEAEHAS